MRRHWLLWGLSALLLTLVALSAAAQQLLPEGFDVERIQSATVFVMQVRSSGDNLIVTCAASGTIVTRDGLVLTNAHNTVSNTDCPGETLIIALTIRPDEPPVPKYRAEVVQYNPGIDLALLRITRELDGRLIAANSLALPFVELADSSQVNLDDTLTVIGYPGIGNDPVSIVRGTISGFAAEPGGGERSWIKTGAPIPGTMSGGGAYDRLGRLVGIPTTAPVVTRETCLAVQDTNADGLINISDSCIPVGGFINALRPANFARPLLRAASLGLTVEKLSEGRATASAAGAPAFSRLFFAPSVTDEGMPTSVIASLPTGSTSLYLFFDYEGMTPETIYSLQVTIDGIPNATFSLAPVRWSGGTRGMWYVGSSGQPYPNGVYEFTLYVNGITAGTRQLVIGGPAETKPTFSALVFGLLDARGDILGNGYVLPAGNVASASFIYQNMTDGMAWTAIWYYGGQTAFRETYTWSDGAAGTKIISIENPGGLFPGSYRLELYLENTLGATADFTIAGGAEGALPLVFTNPRFVSADSPALAVNAIALSSFPNAVDALYVLFDWSQLAPGTLWTLRWLVDGQPFYEQTLPWNGSDSGVNFITRLTGPSRIPDGTYRVDWLVNGVLIQSAQAQVGIGQLPIDRFAQVAGVQLRGRILDADTGQGIAGVTFIVISDQFSVSDFVWDQRQVFTSAVTDREGRFRLDRPLQFRAPYSVIIHAQGYLPIARDAVEVDEDTPNPLELLIYLTRD